MPPVQLLIKPASGNCSLRCSYCFYLDEMDKRKIKNRGFMTADTLETIVKKALDDAEGSCSFAFQGGEPTLSGLSFYQDLIRFEKKYNRKKVKIYHSIQTNGFGLGEEWADFFVENFFLVGISLDGIKPVHDAFRRQPDGSGTFWPVMDTIRLFDQKGVDFNILTVVNARTAPRISKIYSFYQKQGWRYLQFIPCLDPLAEAPGNREYSLTPALYGDFLTALFDLWYLDVKKGSWPYIRMFDNYISILMGRQPEACDQKGSCSLQMVVEADGSVYPCDFYATDEYQIGNILEDSLDDLRQKGMASGFIQKSLESQEDCRACPYHFLCRGGCRRNRLTDERGILGRNYFCPAYKQFFQACLPQLKELAASAAALQ